MTQEVKSVDEFHNILDEAVQNDTYIIVDFYTTWCGPCKQLAPVYEELAQEYSEDKTIKFLKVDVQELEELGDEYEIFSIPTLKNNEKNTINIFIGICNTNTITNSITNIISITSPYHTNKIFNFG